ncbi:MAG TPA: hypothetical protein PLB05_01095 [Candidatus Omnitrophota bacterium]|nr:hypothetical protein [Candidatus Omnitrophota bacterium]
MKNLFESSFSWLLSDYSNHNFFCERDIVWTLQKYILGEIKDKQLPFSLFNEWPMEPKKQYADLVIGAKTSVEQFKPEEILEVKYEPDRNRKIFLKTKFPVVSLKEFKKDIDRVSDFVRKGTVEAGYCLFVDEGGYYKEDHAALKDAERVSSDNNGPVFYLFKFRSGATNADAAP